MRRRLGRATDAHEELVVGKGPDRGDEKVGARFQDPLGMGAHRVVARAFEHGVETVVEKSRDVVGDFAHSDSLGPGLAHQNGRNGDTRHGSVVERLQQIPGDRAVAYQS